MTDDIVFVTGGTGHLGFRALVVALQSGYRVRAAIRSEARKKNILSAPSIKALDPRDRLAFVVVPDITVDGAYDEAVKGATFVLHLASAIPLKGEVNPEDYQAEFIEPAVAGTISVLKAAVKAPEIKRVVITSSIVAIVAPEYFFERDPPKDMIVDHRSRTYTTSGPFPSDKHAYNAGKVAALEATEAFIRDHKPSFGVINIHPSFVTGMNELVSDSKDIILGTNVVAMGSILGNTNDIPILGASVHVDDVALMHVKALDPEVHTGSYIANSNGDSGTLWQDATKIVAQAFPKAVADGILPNNGEQPTRRVRVDATRTEEIMGFKFLSYEEQVKSVVRHYLELRGLKAE